MNLTNKLLSEAEWICPNDITDSTFERKLKVHDWRNHVPGIIQENWNNLGHNERLLVMITADKAASAEDWN